MKLKEVAVISGKPGLYQILKPTRNGVIIEAIGGGRSKIMADASHRISILKEISIYTTTEEGSVPLQDVFHKIYDKYALNLDVKTSDNKALKGLLNDILPEWDKDRVYTSDIKKLVMWYNILAEHAPELIDPAQKEEDEEDEKAVVEQREESQDKLEENPEEPVTISKMEAKPKDKKKAKKVEEKVDAMVEAETTAKDSKEKKPKKTTKKATKAKTEEKAPAKTKKTTTKTSKAKKEEK
ncbi:DUF5606 domain-containing protein [Bernardetia sp.]|uniref:DUF5606 family protein n=1 Tax=Bernardetia sp. TaxID=1937974 RepID=UPI0025BC4E6B|nr:DUF5606 domain-containing protein [Bernardetia sp.]